MTKIIKLDGEDVLLGTDDGKIRKVRIYDVHFAPAEGDEVEVYENDGSIIVTKKETPKENNYNNHADNYVVQNHGTDIVRVFLYIAMIVSIIACFLPLFSISVLGYSYSINYVYNEGKIADGIFIIGIQLLAIILLSFKKRTAVCILELLTIPIIVYTVYNASINISSNGYVSLYSLFGIGFYILAISLITSVILASIHAIKK
jgi:hypothetical protein